MGLSGRTNANLTGIHCSNERSMFSDAYAGFGNSIALYHNDEEVTYDAFDAMVERAAARIVGNRELVFLEARNEPESIAAFIACIRYRHPVYLFAKGDRPKAIKLAQDYRANRIITFDGSQARHETNCNDRLDLAEELRVLLSTSGTTGSPKLVKLSASNLQSNAAAIAEYLALSSTDRALTSLPFNYSFGMSVITSHLVTGASLILTDRSVIEPEFWTLARDRKATSFSGVPHSFELLRAIKHPWFDTPSLRHVAQAGGRLAPDLVREFAALGEAKGWRFFAMYGQTEASPRMAFLPPEMALQHPECIGIPIPGGSFDLLDADGHPATGASSEGELVYSGPNVMMGYAEDLAGLATEDTPSRLMTGDIARRNALGLYEIVGRKSRFLKPFGIRINLDEVEAQVRHWLADAICTGTDARIVIASVTADDAAMRAATDHLAQRYSLPPHIFHTVKLPEIPRLPQGKIDYQAIVRLTDPRPPLETSRSFHGTVLSRRFLYQVIKETRKIIGLEPPDWESVAAIFEMASNKDVSALSSFRSLEGDSLTYLQVAMALEEYLGEIPEGWEDMTVSDLEACARNEPAV